MPELFTLVVRLLNDSLINLVETRSKKGKQPLEELGSEFKEPRDELVDDDTDEEHDLEPTEEQPWENITDEHERASAGESEPGSETSWSEEERVVNKRSRSERRKERARVINDLRGHPLDVGVGEMKVEQERDECCGRVPERVVRSWY